MHYTSTLPEFRNVKSDYLSLRELDMLERADGLAKVSSCSPHRLGAVIFKRNIILGRGYNSNKSHPLQARFSRFSIRLHAEIAAVVDGLRENEEELHGATIAVSRITRKGLRGCSFPCGACLGAINSVGIHRLVCYDTSDKPTAIDLKGF